MNHMINSMISVDKGSTARSPSGYVPVDTNDDLEGQKSQSQNLYM